MNEKAQTGWIIFALFVFVLIGLSIFLSYSSVDKVTITIKDKERIQDRGDSKYLIFTTNEVFENTDTLLFMKFDSSDIYNKFEVGKTYKVKVNWYRIPFLSTYRNILEVKN